MYLFYYVVFTVTITSAEKFSYSFFTKTQIIRDTCDDANEISRTSANSIFQCHIACSGNTNCRRLLYCSFDSSCILYLDGTDCGTRIVSSTCSCYKKAIGCSDSGCTCPLGFYGNDCLNVVQDCKEAENRSIGGGQPMPKALVYIQPDSNQPPIEVPCILNHGGGLILMNRYSFCLFENFNTSLTEYEKGFGAFRYNRWVGFNTVKAVMANHPSSIFQLQVILSNASYQDCDSFYNNFQLGDRSDDYRLSFSDYYPGSTCGDALASQRGFPFSTYDDDKTGTRRCARTLGGGWWFNNDVDCTTAFLTGTMDTSATGNIWHENLRDQMLKKISVIMWIA